jgi:hypothetical protein
MGLLIEPGSPEPQHKWAFFAVGVQYFQHVHVEQLRNSTHRWFGNQSHSS